VRKRNFISCIVIILLFVTTECRAVTDDMWNLVIDVGETYSLSGKHRYFSSVQIKGTLTIPDTTGWLLLEAPTIRVFPTGKIDGNGVGSIGGPGRGHDYGLCSDLNRQYGLPSGGGYGGHGIGGCCVHIDYPPAIGFPGGKPYGTEWIYGIDMGSGGGMVKRPPNLREAAVQSL